MRSTSTNGGTPTPSAISKSNMANDRPMRVAAIGDLHVQETDVAPYRELFAEISSHADVLALCGEPIAKLFVDEAMNEARKLENQLRTLRTERSVAVLHYSPIVDTIEGEPEAIFQYLGSQRLCDPIDRFDHVKAVVHGHAHHGTYEGRTPLGKPVFNVAQFVVKPLFGRPYALIEV